MTKTTSNGDIRDLINNQRLETKADIRDLATKLDTLSIKVDKIDKAQAVSSTKVGMIVGGISLVVSAIVSVFLESIKGKTL